MLFPWGKAALVCFGVLFSAVFVYRLSETAGLAARRACLTAMFVTLGGGLIGLYSVAKTWGREVYAVLIGVLAGAVIRLLICGASLAIIVPFTTIDRSWYVLFLGVYYTGFLAVDTWFALWVLRNNQSEIEKQNKIHGNLWDIVG